MGLIRVKTCVLHLIWAKKCTLSWISGEHSVFDFGACFDPSQGFINASFENITSTEHALSLLKQFEAILQRETLKVRYKSTEESDCNARIRLEACSAR
eukprot:285805-Rhodomonas_salina.1